MSYVSPAEVVAEAIQAAEKKAGLPIRDMLVRGFLSGAFLGFATSLAMVIWAQGLPHITGAVAFPIGFVMLVLLGLELATGNFALMPQGLMAGRVQLIGLLRNWGWVYLGNLIGSVFYGALFYLVVSNFGSTDGGAVADQVLQIAEKKTLGYSANGLGGWGTALVSAILCNWMVTVGTMLAFSSRGTIGKIAVMWLPILTFFALGYEHSVVNMFVIPTGIFFGAPISAGDWWLWNQIPVTIGNIVGGAVFTGLALYVTYGRRASNTRSSANPLATDRGRQPIKPE